MFCKNCGAQMDDASAFCSNCGEKAGPSPAAEEIRQPAAQSASPGAPSLQSQPAPAPMAPLSPIKPVNSAPPVPPPAQPQAAAFVPPPVPAYAGPAPAMAKVKKKRHIGLWVFLFIFVSACGAVVYSIASIAWFPPKDLGITYTQADYNRAAKKIGMHIKADLGNGVVYDNKKILAGSTTDTGLNTTDKAAKEKLKHLDTKHYKYKFSNYKRKTVKLNPVEATAFANETIMPEPWFDDIQVNITPDGAIESSSKANAQLIISDLFPDVADKIPDSIPIPEEVNIYTLGDMSIDNNDLTFESQEAEAGVYQLPDQYKTPDTMDIIASYVTRFAEIGDLTRDIISFGVENGQFVFDGYIPTEVEITPIAP